MRLQSRCQSHIRFHNGSLTWLAGGLSPSSFRLSVDYLSVLKTLQLTFPRVRDLRERKKASKKPESYFFSSIQLYIQNLNAILTPTPGVSGNFIVLGLSPTRLSPLQTSSYPYLCPFNYKCRSLLEWLIELRKVFYLQLLFYYKGSNSGITK